MDEFYLKLSQRIRAFRKERKIKQIDVAKAIGLNGVIYNKVENFYDRTRKLTVKELMKLHKLYGFPLDHTDLLD